MKILLSLPFLLIYLLIIIAFCGWRGYKRMMLGMIAGVILGLYLLCTPLMTNTLLAILGKYPPVLQPDRLREQGYQAIIVLGGGLYQGQEMNGQAQAGGHSLTRLRYAAHLARASQLPVLLSGIEAPAMASTLIQDFGIAAKWLEANSEDTNENAKFSTTLLRQQGVGKAVLVTDVWHMGRSKVAFNHYGLETLAAPTNYPLAFFIHEPRLLAPKTALITMNLFGVSECFGQIKYRLQYWWAEL